jgi:hypothetical protein
MSRTVRGIKQKPLVPVEFAQHRVLAEMFAQITFVVRNITMVAWRDSSNVSPVRAG